MAAVEPLDSEWQAALDSQLQWVEGWITPGSEDKFADPAGKRALVGLILDSDAILPEETPKLRALGVYLGQAISDETDWPWRVLIDEYGSDLAILFAEPDAVIFPATLISKRVERGEAVDVDALASGVVAACRDAQAKM